MGLQFHFSQRLIHECNFQADLFKDRCATYVCLGCRFVLTPWTCLQKLWPLPPSDLALFSVCVWRFVSLFSFCSFCDAHCIAFAQGLFNTQLFCLLLMEGSLALFGSLPCFFWSAAAHVRSTHFGPLDSAERGFQSRKMCAPATDAVMHCSTQMFGQIIKHGAGSIRFITRCCQIAYSLRRTALKL